MIKNMQKRPTVAPKLATLEQCMTLEKKLLLLKE